MERGVCSAVRGERCRTGPAPLPLRRQKATSQSIHNLYTHIAYLSLVQSKKLRRRHCTVGVGGSEFSHGVPPVDPGRIRHGSRSALTWHRICVGSRKYVPRNTPVIRVLAADADPTLQLVYCGYSRVPGQGGRGEEDQQGNGEHQETVQGSVQLPGSCTLG